MDKIGLAVAVILGLALGVVALFSDGFIVAKSSARSPSKIVDVSSYEDFYAEKKAEKEESRKEDLPVFDLEEYLGNLDVSEVLFNPVQSKRADAEKESKDREDRETWESSEGKEDVEVLFSEFLRK